MMELESEGAEALPLKLESLLGRGAIGEVWKARSPLGFVAVKCIELGDTNDKERELATQEAQLLKRIKHPYIVRYLDLVISGSQMRIVMQLLQGDLAQAIAWRWEHRLGGFREEQLWQWLWHLCSALAFLHRVKILHRDVKPANIFLSKTNDAVLGDFSIAKVLSVATTNTQIGTPGYKAPEVWLGHRYGAKSDIFSLGCSIYEATELRRAFRALASEAYRPSPVLRSCVSNALRLVLRSMLEKTPQRRAGAADLLRRIKTSRSTCLGEHMVFGGTPRVTTPRSNKCKNSHPAPSRCRRSVEAEVDVCDGSYPGHWGGICPWKDRVEVSSFYGLEESFIDQTLSCVDTLVFSSSEGESEEDPPFHGDPFQFADVVDPLETTRSTGDW